MKFWGDFFKVDYNTLRNVLNFLAYPIYSKENPNEIKEILSFKDQDPAKPGKLIGEMTPEEYLDYSNWLRE